MMRVTSFGLLSRSSETTLGLHYGQMARVHIAHEPWE